MRVANIGASALTEVYGTRYTVGSSADILCKLLLSLDANTMYLYLFHDNLQPSDTALVYRTKIGGALRFVASTKCIMGN